MSRFASAFSIAAALAATACTTPQERLNHRVASVPESERAYVIGTYAVDCTPSRQICRQSFNSISTAYRNASDGEMRGTFTWTSGSVLVDDTIPDYVQPEQGEKGFYFCQALPAGAYEVYSYHFYNFAGGGSGYSIRERDQFALPFQLAPGEVVDLGKLHVTTTTGKNVFGMTLPAPGILQLSRDTQEASGAALRKCPEIVRGKTAREMRLQPAVATPFVRSVPSGSPAR